VRKLATLIKQRSDRGEHRVFVMAQLSEFLPSCCPEYTKVLLAAQPDAQV
jgi:hypothetical protein